MNFYENLKCFEIETRWKSHAPMTIDELLDLVHEMDGYSANETLPLSGENKAHYALRFRDRYWQYYDWTNS